MTSEYDDAIWQAVPTGDRPLDQRLVAAAPAFLAGGEAALDLGCGDGQYLPLLAEHCAEVIGADRSRVALGRAADRAPSADLQEVGPDERLPLDDNIVDRVWCVDTIEHVLDTQVVLSEARRVLRPGGSLLVATPAHPFHLRLKLAFSGWEAHFDPFSPHLRFYTKRSLAETLAECGFDAPDVRSERGLLLATARRG